MIPFDEIVTVQVCLRCGRGFPPWSVLSTRVDTLPVWWTTTETSPVCGGQILSVSRHDQIHRVEVEEFLEGEQWTPEEIKSMTEAQDAQKAKPAATGE
ncbi:MAG TPA: hypothetical protein VK577_20875 [Bradyrhizobium sp.]|nr:hypothetical protein [Bradyrhizobium sp.]